jgi:hypothetical protein
MLGKPKGEGGPTAEEDALALSLFRPGRVLPGNVHLDRGDGEYLCDRGRSWVIAHIVEEVKASQVG